MNTLRIAIIAAALVLAGCEVADPMIIAVGLPLEVSAEVNSGNSWDETETINLEDEITGVDVDYLDDVHASRVNDITIRMEETPSSGTSSGSLTYSSPAIAGGAVFTLATWTDLPLSAFAGSGLSLLAATGVTVDAGARTQLLDALQDTSGLPLATTFTVHTNGTTSVTVAGGTKLIAAFQYQVDVEI